MGLIRKTTSLVRHRFLRWRQCRARRRGNHEQAYALLMRELYTDFSRPMTEIHLDMAWERLAAGKADDANALLRLIDDSRLETAVRNDKRLLQCWVLVEHGKHNDAENRLRALDDVTLTAAQASRKKELMVEVHLVRRDLEGARDLAATPELEAWRLVVEAEMSQREGGREALASGIERARAALGSRADSPWLRRRMDRLLRDRK